MVWQPGESGCPGGWNFRKKPWRDAIERALKRQQTLLIGKGGKLTPSLAHADYTDPTLNGKFYVAAGQSLEVIADLAVQQALCGDKDMIYEIGNRLDGRPPQTVEGGDFPLVHTVTWLDDNADEVVDGEVVEVHANGNGTTTLMPPKPEPQTPSQPDDAAALEGDTVTVVDLDDDDEPIDVTTVDVTNEGTEHDEGR